VRQQFNTAEGRAADPLCSLLLHVTPPSGLLRPTTIISRAQSACADPVNPPPWVPARRVRTHQHTRAFSAVVSGLSCEVTRVTSKIFYRLGSCLQALSSVANYERVIL
jgi:hypothetical protein